MTRLAKIETRGLRSRDRAVTLTGRDAILGRSRSGKTTLRDAVVFLATGKNPSAGDSLAHAARMMRGNEMSVRVEWDDGSWAERGIRRKGRGFTELASASFVAEGAGLSETKAAILERFGATDAEAVQNLDLVMFARLSGPKQAEAVNALLDGSGMDADELQRRLGAMAAVRVSQGGDVDLPEDEASWPTIQGGRFAEMSPALQHRFGNILQDAYGRIETEGLSEAIAWSKTYLADAKARKARRTNARAEIEDRHALVDAPATTLDDLNAERQTLTDRIAVLRSEIKAHGEQAEALESAEKALSEAQASLDGILAAGDPEAGAAKLRAQAVDLKAQAAELADPPQVVAPENEKPRPKMLKLADDLDAEAVKLRDEAKQATPPEPEYEQRVAVPSTQAAETDVKHARSAVEKAKADPWTEVREIAQDLILWDEFGETKGARLRELANENGLDLTRCELDAEAAAQALADAEAARDKATVENYAIDDRNAKRREEVKAARLKIEDLRRQGQAKTEEAGRIRKEEASRVDAENAARRKSYTEDFAERAGKADAIAQKRRLLLDQAEQAEENARNLIRNHEGSLSKVSTAQARLDGMESTAPLDVTAHELEIETAKQAIAKIDETKRAVEGADARRTELAEITAQIEDSEAEFKVAAAVAWCLPKLRDLDLAQRRGPILDRMRVFLNASGIGDRPYLRAKKGAVEYGLAAGSDHPDLEVGEERHGSELSGAEGILFRAAFWNAIVSLRDPHTRVLAMEIDDLDDGPAVAFFKGLAALDVPTVLVFTNRALPIPEGFAVHAMDAPAAAEAVA